MSQVQVLSLRPDMGKTTAFGAKLAVLSKIIREKQPFCELLFSFFALKCIKKCIKSVCHLLLIIGVNKLFFTHTNTRFPKKYNKQNKKTIKKRIHFRDAHHHFYGVDGKTTSLLLLVYATLTKNQQFS